MVSVCRTFKRKCEEIFYILKWHATDVATPVDVDFARCITGYTNINLVEVVAVFPIQKKLFSCIKVDKERLNVWGGENS